MKKRISELVKISYRNGVLDAGTVEKIAGKLSRTHLKAYIRALKEHERRTTVTVEVPTKNGENILTDLGKQFEGKRLIVKENPELLLGLRITDNDDVYNMNLKNNLERMSIYAAE